jgi:methane monooxygenase PmoA-like
MNRWFFGCLVAACTLPGMAFAANGTDGVQVVADQAHQRVDITIDGKPFTSYVWPSSLKKPVLYPLIASDGIDVVRGFPLAPRPGERVDHPHHAGIWFNYGNVNGFDFWNNSDAIKPADRAKMGTIHQQRIVSTKSGRDSGELAIDSVWTTGTGHDILEQRTRYIFSRQKDERIIDQVTTLHALDHVVFNDDKEGLLGIRVARWLESADEKGGTFTDANGRTTEVPASNTPGATGVYLTSEGKQGGQAWGTRGRWCALTGNTEGHTATLAIFDHSGNPNYPTYWHARGYGLFAANPLGQHIFDPKAPPLNYTLDKNQNVTFTYRILLLPRAPQPGEMNHDADKFASDYR